MRDTALLAGFLVALAATAPAQETSPPSTAARSSPGRFTLSLGGAFGLGSLTYQSSLRFREFAEDGRLEADYTSDAGPGLEAGLTYRFSRRLGVSAAFTRLSRDGHADYRADFPHPLFLARDRHVEATAEGLSYEEEAGHLDLVLHGRSGALGFAVFAGPSLLKAKSSVLTKPQYAHTYPYDSVTVNVTPTRAVDGNAVGFNVGAGVNLRLLPHLGLGLQGRFARASVKLEGESVEPVSLDAGGFQATAGVRVIF